MYSPVFVLASILPPALRRHVQSFETNPLVPLASVLVRKYFEYSFTERSRTYIINRAKTVQSNEEYTGWKVCYYIQLVLKNFQRQPDARLETIVRWFRSHNVDVRSCYHRPFMRELLFRVNPTKLWRY